MITEFDKIEISNDVYDLVSFLEKGLEKIEDKNSESFLFTRGSIRIIKNTIESYNEIIATNNHVINLMMWDMKLTKEQIDEIFKI